MHTLALIAFWTLVGITLHHIYWTLVMVRVLLRRPRTVDMASDQELPKAAVLLCLRGADPSLPSCLRRLIRQNYPRYGLFIAVDSESDPAWEVVQDTIRESQAGHVQVMTLRNRLSTCSLKCSSLVHLVDALDDSYEVIVLADADLESHSTWLRELVAPLTNPKIGATFGNRWFMPVQGSLGSLIRQLWNAPGLVVMHVLKIPWAGSLAIRADLFRRGGLRDKWSRSIVDDGPVRIAAKEQNLKLHFVPSLIMANREDCHVGFACNFLRRQLMWTRTYVRPWWLAMLAYSSFAIGSWMAAVLLGIACAFNGLSEAAYLFGAGATLLGVVSFALFLVLDLSARRVVRGQGESAPKVSSRQVLQLPIAMLVTPGVHLWASVVATFRHRVTWRGVTYEIRGPFDVKMMSDGPHLLSPAESAISI